MKKVRLAAGVILIFFVGALAGTLATNLYMRHRIGRLPPGGPHPPPPPPARGTMLMEQLTRDLELTKDQRQRIAGIVEDAERRILGVRRKYLPAMKEIEDQTFGLIKEKLTPDQRKKVEDLQERLSDRHARAFLQSVEVTETADQVLSRLATPLGLSENQRWQLRPLIDESLAKRRAVVDRYRRQPSPDVPLLMDEVRELDLSLESGLSKILTGKQMGRYRELQGEEHRKNHPHPPPPPPP
jgi:Spy/CpxP family protein refolding chaperone